MHLTSNPKWSFLGDNSCIVFMESEKEATRLVNFRHLQGGGRGGRLEFKKWKPEMNTLGNEPVENRRWIRVHGLPLHLWSMGFFRAIGGLSGGFVSIDDETTSLSSCEAVRICVQGGPLHRIPQVISLFDRGRNLAW